MSSSRVGGDRGRHAWPLECDNVLRCKGEERAVEAERRQIAVLFTDVVGFTAFSEHAGEEAAFMLMQRLARLMEEAVAQQGGVVHGFTGDGVMAVFGAPLALEDAPLRACRAALAILKQLDTEGADLETQHGVRPQLRIGVNAGLAIVGQVQSGAGVTVLGDAVNVAARLQAEAEPGATVLSEAIYRLVEGLIEATYLGERRLKGKTAPQKVYRLEAVRRGANRFQASAGRGLTEYVGRERELEALEQRLAQARSRLVVVDIVAEPGMGKSRLIHQFRERIAQRAAIVLCGHCALDGQQTPFLALIEVVRGSFDVRAGEGDVEIARKLERGLNLLGLHSAENLGLLLNLLGLKAVEDSLAGLDGVLVGLRTRELIHRLLQARCQFSPVVLLVEDLHWIDSVSQEVLDQLVTADYELPLLLLHTRRPEYAPPWLGRSNVTKLHLEPLPVGDIRRIVQARLGVEAMPDELERLVTDKAEGNALFAEEIVSFLVERGELGALAAKPFDVGTMSAALPANIQNLLTARVDRLEPADRALLQAAAVIGRRFNPELLGVMADAVETRLASLRALDLIHPEGGEYMFKHALMRDALYQNLLSGPRAALHLKIAEQIELRSGNRLAEVVDILAHHFSQTDRADKAFAYLAMAGDKSLGVYSLDESGKYFDAAVALLDSRPDCATDRQVAALLVGRTLHSHLTMQFKSLTDAVERFAPRMDRSAVSHERVRVQHHYVLALYWMGRYGEATKAQVALTAMAEEVNDARSKAYALASALHLATGIAPHSVEAFEALSVKAIADTAHLNDAHLRYFVLFAVGWEEFHRGRMGKAQEAAEKLIAVGRGMKDPRSIGYGLALQAWIALISDDYLGALQLAETSVGIARTPVDREMAKVCQIAALILLRRAEAFQTLRELMDKCTREGWHWYLVSLEGIWGVALAMQGDVGLGIAWMNEAIQRRDREGYRMIADWYRTFLCDIYLEIVARNERPSLKVLARNMVALAGATFTAERRITELIAHVRENPQVDPNGHHIGRCEMILGLFYKARNKRALAVRHLGEAKRITAPFGPTPMLTKIVAALGELG